jgi:hypothetical protein
VLVDAVSQNPPSDCSGANKNGRELFALSRFFFSRCDCDQNINPKVIGMYFNEPLSP